MYNPIAVTSQDKIAGTFRIEIKNTFADVRGQFSFWLITSEMQSAEESDDTVSSRNNAAWYRIGHVTLRIQYFDTSSVTEFHRITFSLHRRYLQVNGPCIMKNESSLYDAATIRCHTGGGHLTIPSCVRLQEKRWTDLPSGFCDTLPLMEYMSPDG